MVTAFYAQAIPRTFPTLPCRFDEPVTGVGAACPLRRDVVFGHVDVWFDENGLKPGETFVRLAVG